MSTSETATSHTPRSGEQFALSAGGYTAVIASVGATLRSLQFNGRDLIVPFDADEVRPHARGAILAPWPNRIADGSYSFDGETHQLALSEPARHNAIHGLVGWQVFTATQVGVDRVQLCTNIPAQTGYPFQVRVTVDFFLDETGLTQSVTGKNFGRSAAPWGVGFHPYLVADGAPDSRVALTPVDEWTLTVPARELLLASSDRLLPLRLAPVDSQPEYDFRSARLIGDTQLDHAFTGLGDDSGSTEIRVVGPHGNGVAMAWDEQLPWVQLYSSDSIPGTPEHRRGLAVEPMTCPADAFNSGTNLVRLEAGDSHRVTWRIYALT